MYLLLIYFYNTIFMFLQIEIVFIKWEQNHGGPDMLIRLDI